jgi:hypothetical protein
MHESLDDKITALVPAKAVRRSGRSMGLPVPRWPRPRYLLVGLPAMAAAWSVAVATVAFGLSGLVGLAAFAGIAWSTALTLAGRDAPGPGDGAAFDEIDGIRAKRLAAALSRAPGPVTVEQICAELRWTDEAVIRGLAHLRESSRVSEDVDLASGHFVYSLIHESASDEVDDLERRIAEALAEADAFAEARGEPESVAEPEVVAEPVTAEEPAEAHAWQ